LAAPADVAATPATTPTAGVDTVKVKLLMQLCCFYHKLDAKSNWSCFIGVAIKYDMAWIYKWVHNSELIKSGDTKRVKYLRECNKSVTDCVSSIINYMRILITSSHMLLNL
jgi:hypothetical protein